MVIVRFEAGLLLRREKETVTPCIIEWHDRLSTLLIFNGKKVPPIPTSPKSEPLSDADKQARRKSLRLELRLNELLNFTYVSGTADPQVAPSPTVVLSPKMPKSSSIGTDVSQGRLGPVVSFGRIHYIKAGSKGVVKDVLKMLDFRINDDFEQYNTAAAKTASRMIQRRLFPHGPLNFIVFISPVSGKGKGEELWKSVAEPILLSTPHNINIVKTTHRGHAEEYAAKNELGAADVLVAVGGDGMAHEVVNGLHQRQRREMQTATEVPAGDSAEPPPHGLASSPKFTVDGPIPRIGLFPTGSGCALAKTLGIIEPLDAAIALAHTQSKQMDLLSVTITPPSTPVSGNLSSKPFYAQPVKAPLSRVAFLAVCFGLSSAIDIESEKYRWMGNARFTAYAIEKVVKGIPEYGHTVRYRPVILPGIAAKSPLRCPDQQYSDAAPQAAPGNTSMFAAEETMMLDSTALISKVLKPFEERRDLLGAGQGEGVVKGGKTGEWVEMAQKNFAWLHVGNIPWIARDCECFPFARLNDRSIDVVSTVEKVSRASLVSILLKMEDGNHVTHEKVQYAKVREIEVIPTEGSIIDVDGEAMPFGNVHIRLLPEMLNIIRCAVP